MSVDPDPGHLRRQPLFSLLSLALIGLPHGVASAQQQVPQAPQVTPRDLRPAPPVQPPVALPPQPLRSAPPPNADKLFVRLGDVRVQGGFDGFAAPTERLIAPLRGRRVSVADLYALGDAVEALYRQAGYPLVRVVLPPQSVADDAALRITVIDGFIEGLNLDAVPARTRHAVARALEPLVGRRHLRDAELERALTLAGRGPGLALRSALGAGRETGGTVLVLQGTLAPLAASVSSDNRQTDSIGPWQFTTQVRANQLLGLGEQAYAYVSGGYPPGTAFHADAPRRVAGGGLIVPLLANGLSINPEFTISDTRPRTPVAELASRSQLKRWSLRLIYPAIVTRSQELTLTGVVEASRQSDSLPFFQFTQDLDRLRVARFAADWSGAVAAGQARASATLSQGSGRFGGRGGDEIASTGVPMSRPGATAAFTKLEASVSYDAALAWGLQGHSVLRGQKAIRGVMPSAEIFSMDGEDGLSALTAGALSDDGGWVLRQEVAHPFALPDAAAVLPYGYWAVARPSTRLPGGTAQSHATSWGLGLRTGWRNVSLAAEWGRASITPSGRRTSQAFFKAQVQY
jgi:hemolysin activation/secretion protein